MEKKHNEITKKQDTGSEGKKITRKEAIKKTGYMAVSAATMMILLNKNAQAGGNSANTSVAPIETSGKKVKKEKKNK